MHWEADDSEIGKRMFFALLEVVFATDQIPSADHFNVCPYRYNNLSSWAADYR